MNIISIFKKLKNITKKQRALIFKIITISSVILFTTYNHFTENETQEKYDIFKTTNTQTSKVTATENLIQSDKNTYPVLYTFDGDTYFININGKKEKIRVLGIDTPEKKGGFRPEGCFGDHASDYAKEKLKNKKVSLLKPKGYDETDKYGRLLRYVFLDGEDFGAHLISEGYAFSYKKFKHPRRSYYNTLEKEAQKNKKGMWNPSNCDYWGGLHY